MLTLFAPDHSKAHSVYLSSLISKTITVDMDIFELTLVTEFVYSGFKVQSHEPASHEFLILKKVK